MIIRFTDKSKADLESAFYWYENQSSGLGVDFLNSVKITLNNISEFPEMYNLCYSNFRRCILIKFPFSIFYTIHSNEIVIHSVFDNRQNPEKRPVSN